MPTLTITVTNEQLAQMSSADPVGRIEVAERLGVTTATVKSWRYTGDMPEPRWTISGTPIWDWNLDIAPWAATTGRANGPRRRGRPRKIHVVPAGSITEVPEALR